MDVIQPLAAVALVLALLLGALVLLKNRGAARFNFPGLSIPGRLPAGPRRMELLERVALSPHHALHLVRVGDRCLVVATSPSSSQLLCDLGNRPEVKQP